ncbi:MAG: SDR family NAD(P)-dependent oxidoreductase [Pseudomonadota bacterium]
MSERYRRVAIVGASGGLGRAVAAQLLTRSGLEQLHLCARNRERLSGGITADPRSNAHSIDLIDEPSIARAAASIKCHTDTLDLVLFAAGLLHRAEGDPPVRPERRLGDITPEAMLASYQLNALAPILVAKHFVELLPRRRAATWVNVSARVGSIGDNRLGGWYAYRSAKAAQNMLTRTLAIEFSRTRPNTICVAMHPGTVDTALSKPFQRNLKANQLVSAEHAASRLLHVIDNLTPEAHGGFLNWDGTPLAW